MLNNAFSGLSAVIFPRVPAPPPIKDAWDEYLERKDKVIVYTLLFHSLKILVIERYHHFFYEMFRKV